MCMKPKKLFFYDLETTGLFPTRNGIHQLSAIIEIDGVLMETINYRIRPNPKAVIDQVALAACKVTEEQILGYPPMEDQFKQILSVLKEWVDQFDKKDKFHLIGYNNLKFDNEFFRQFFDQNGNSHFDNYFWSGSMDVMSLAAYYLLDARADMPSFKLSRVAKTLGIEIDEEQLHDSMYDVQITKQIYERICKDWRRF